MVTFDAFAVLHVQPGVSLQARCREQERIFQLSANVVLPVSQQMVFPIEVGVHRCRLLLFVAGVDKGTVSVRLTMSFLVGGKQ